MAMNLLQQVFDTDAPVALITGSGAPRVGRAIAIELASHGCQIALHANTSTDEAREVSQDLQKRFRTRSIVTTGSLSDETIPQQLVDETTAAFGRLDILVNSAAIWWPTRLEDITAEEIRTFFNVNSVGSFLCARAAGQVMTAQRQGGAIVNIGDWATVRPYLDHAAYFPSKGAIDVMTRSLAVELATRNSQVRVNCVKPGPVLLAEEVDDQQRRKLCQSTLAGDIGTAEHVAHAVRFLCENSFVNGACLAVDGGRSIYAPDGLQVGENTG
jgi:NAD(P)-dependent dehydrogenase (short-subunit alcohol dehydrogenase family)